jgi:glutamate 5-kinase
MKKMKRIVVKVGTRTLTSEGNKLDRRSMLQIVRQLCSLADRGVEVILVTSGAIASGMGLLGLKKRPLKLASLQAVAAIGQNHLMDIYSELFNSSGYIAAQMLLTQEDFNDRTRYLNIKYTLNELLRHKAIPVINENDTVSTEEIRCGDNDRLSSLVADLAEAAMLIILTDTDGLLDEGQRVVAIVDEIDERILKLIKTSRCEVSAGGMATKVEAARRANASGIDCVVANGRAKDVILKIAEEERVGTLFRARKTAHLARKRWIAFSSRPRGAIVVDNGARDVIEKMNKSLLPSGITAVEGEFKARDTISILDKSGREFARGIVNYSSEEVARIKGLKSGDLARTLGYKAKDEVIHKDNLVIL